MILSTYKIFVKGNFMYIDEDKIIENLQDVDNKKIKPKEKYRMYKKSKQKTK